MLLTNLETVGADIVELTQSTSIVRARNPLPPELVAARHQLEMEGFTIASGAAVRAGLGDGFDLSEILAAVRAAPFDQYDQASLRQKLYSQVFRHHNGTISAVPPFDDGPNSQPYTTYFQASHFNGEFGNQHRRFAPFPKAILESSALLRLINLCFALIPLWRLKGDGRNSILTGVHGQRLNSDGRRAPMSSPPRLHQDGERQTFIVMLQRENVTGGESYVAMPDCAGKSPEDVERDKMLARGTLMNPLDILAVDDERVSHHVSGVLGANGRPGSRSVLLIDFSEIELIRSATPATE